ncbi:efflux RND transporter periplasmic adaptor subunit [bacterium]|nr:efflux RND transporter periplasmic adaptor subunit [bacterium]MBU1599156.1 efflux RND transporter periplasmic adaptor subunit [bacterium]
MKRWIIISVVLIVAILTVWLFFGRKDKNIVKVVKGKVTRGELALKVSARGRIEAKDRYELKAKIPGVVTFILEDGARVKKGDVIALLNNKELLARKASEEANSINYQNRLSSLTRGLEIKEAKSAVEDGEVVFKEAERVFLSSKKLFSSGAISEDEAKRKEVEYKKARLRLDLLITQFESRNKQHQEEIEGCLSTIKSCEANIASIDQQIKWSGLYSPIAGILTKREVKEGYWVVQGQLLCMIVSSDSFIAKCNLDEAEIGKVSIDMLASVLPDAFPKERVSGKITKIASSPALVEKLNTFEVTISLSSVSLALRSEMLADVLIISGLAKDVRKLPQEAVVNIDEKQCVFLIKDNKAIMRQVTLGLKNPTEAEVITGVDVGDEVVLNPPLDLRDGANVTIKKGDVD